MGAIDRRKHDIDVMERVLGSAREAGEDEGQTTEVVDIRMRPWLVGSTTSAVELTVGAVRHEEPTHDHGAEEESDRYDSDRRGEHTYPADDEPEPRSHRERDELRSRLERRG